MRRRHGSTHRCASSKDLEQGFQRSGATDRRTTRVATCMLLPPLWLIPLFQRQHALSAHPDHPETQQKYRAQVILHAHSESECGIAWITLNNTKTTLVVSKSHTVCADISDFHKRYPQVGLVLVSHTCHIGQRWTSHVALQGPGAGAHGTECMDQSPRAEDLKMV